VCPNCQHATTKTISTTTQRRRQRRREEEEDDEDDEEDGDNNEGCPLQLCEKCKYIFLTKGHEENADPEAPIKSLLLSEGEKEEECKGKKIHANRMLFFACGNCEAMLSLPELVARDCVVEESKLVVCGACEELTIMGGFSNSSRLAAGAHQRQRRMPTMPMMQPQPMQPPPAGMMMMMMPGMMFGGGGGHCAYPNAFGGVPFGTGMPQPRQPYSQPPPLSSMFPPLSQENEVGSNEVHQGENAPPYFHLSRAEQSFRDATNQNQKRKY